MHLRSCIFFVPALGALALALALLAGCSSPEAAPSSSDGGTADGSAPGPGGGDGAAPSRIPGCPDTLPAAGSPCTIPSPICEYGDTPHCTTLASCGRSSATGPGAWILSGPDPSCQGNPTGCPATFGAVANGGACPVPSTCTYAEGRCACAPCVTGGGTADVEWECTPWLRPDGCPERAPLIGTACASAGQACAYGAGCCAPVDVGRAIRCVRGYWSNDITPGGGCACAQHICGK